MSDGPTHYEVLGVPPEATAEAIRKRFRELARRYHPDVNGNSPEATERFVRIHQAYETLIDPTRRAAYDLTLRDRARARGASDGRRGAAGPDGTWRPEGGARPGGPGAAGRSGSAARAAAGSPFRPGPEARAGRGAAAEAERRRQSMLRLLEDARQAYARGHLREAQRLCREVLQLGRSGAACEMLGDIAMRQGELDRAVHFYTLAAQLLPNSAPVMAKLSRAAARRASAETADWDPHLPRDVPPGVLTPVQRASYRLSVTLFGFAFLLLVLLWRPLEGETPLGWPLVPNWTPGHLLAMLLAGLIMGGVLAAAGWVRPADLELLYRTVTLGRREVPLGAVAAFVAAISYPAALLLLVIFAVWQGVWSGSLTRAAVAAGALTGAFALGAPGPAQLELLLFGGNVIFVALLAGWIIGDLFRPSWAA